MDIEQFPLLKALETKRISLARLIDVLNPALEAGTISSPDFQSARYDLANIVEAFQEKLGKEFLLAGKWGRVPQQLRAIDLTKGSPLRVPGKVRKLRKQRLEHPLKTAFIAYAREIVVLLDAMASLTVVKRQPKTLDGRDNPLYTPPVASASAMSIVAEVLTRMTDTLKKQYADCMYAMNLESITESTANPMTRERHMKLRFPGRLASLMSMVGDDYDRLNFHYRKMKPNYGDILRASCDSTADDVQAHFLAKNVRRLAKIIEVKGRLKGTPTILELHANSAGFYGDVKVEFEDGSGFTVRNKVVGKYSAHNRAYLQFSTTFHNVTLPGGIMRAGELSEKQMIVDFAPKRQVNDERDQKWNRGERPPDRKPSGAVDDVPDPAPK